jgi:hypothetical protein
MSEASYMICKFGIGWGKKLKCNLCRSSFGKNCNLTTSLTYTVAENLYFGDA